VSNIWDNPDLLVRSGSHLYGCANDDSDIDLRGFVIEPALSLLGLGSFNQFEDKKEDIVIWGIQKFFSLLKKGAPNAIELLFAPTEEIQIATEAGYKLLENRNLFVSCNLTDQIRGFASSEWRKAQLLTKNKNTGEVYFSPRVVGEKRKSSHKIFGYCTKNAYHAIRLLEQGIEILKHGHITFPRPNAAELGAIRDGQIAFQDLAEKREKLAEEFSIEEEKSTIKKRPDKEDIDSLYLDLIRDRIRSFLS